MTVGRESFRITPAWRNNENKILSRIDRKNKKKKKNKQEKKFSPER